MGAPLNGVLYNGRTTVDRVCIRKKAGWRWRWRCFVARAISMRLADCCTHATMLRALRRFTWVRGGRCEETCPGLENGISSRDGGV